MLKNVSNLCIAASGMLLFSACGKYTYTLQSGDFAQGRRCTPSSWNILQPLGVAKPARGLHGVSHHICSLSRETVAFSRVHRRPVDGCRVKPGEPRDGLGCHEKYLQERVTQGGLFLRWYKTSNAELLQAIARHASLLLPAVVQHPYHTTFWTIHKLAPTLINRIMA